MREAEMAAEVLSHTQQWQQLLALVLAATVVMGSPGPATISVTAVGAAFGLRDSLRYASGVIVGTIAVLLMVATGILAVLASMPRLAPLLAIASAAYILYLAFKIATAPPLAARESGADRPTFLGGFLLAVANPKAYVAIAAVLAGASSGAGDLDIPARLAVLALMIVAIHALWLLAGAAFARYLRQPLASRIINLAFAATLVLTTALATWP
jgi:threonine/homoserine/homoserine lactone efflux protein